MMIDFDPFVTDWRHDPFPIIDSFLVRGRQSLELEAA